jgi:hypothetical protein
VVPFTPAGVIASGRTNTQRTFQRMGRIPRIKTHKVRTFVKKVQPETASGVTVCLIKEL